MDTDVSVRELRQNLSVYLRRVERGETLSVTSRGRPVAVLGPLPERESLVDRLVRERGATRPTRRLEDLPSPLRLDTGETPPSETLARQRAERLRQE
jgi:prevent-host-death family protein